MTVKERMIYNVCLFVHKMVCGMMLQYLMREVKFIKNVHEHKTEREDKN